MVVVVVIFLLFDIASSELGDGEELLLFIAG